MRLHYLVAFIATLACATALAATDSKPSPTTLTVSPQVSGEGFNINGSFVVPLDTCQAYNYLTDYELERELPGVISVKHTRIAPRRIRLQREFEDRVLFIPVQIQSVVEITELPYRGMDFVQLSGNARTYKGNWRLEPTNNGTRFVYKAYTDPGSAFPDSMVQQVIEESLRRNFNAMVELAQRRHNQPQSQCATGV